MCDYCDCRSRPPLAAFGAEHERIGSLLADVDRGGDPAALLELLEAHGRREEAGLYPALAAAGVDVAGLDDEHARIHAGLRRGDPAAAAALRAHIHAEEHDLFPAAHQLLSDAAWDELGEP